MPSYLDLYICACLCEHICICIFVYGWLYIYKPENNVKHHSGLEFWVVLFKTKFLTTLKITKQARLAGQEASWAHLRSAMPSFVLCGF